jgi:flavin reductase (DIM6/NTAB) family NADH-FMN oxidoreductase RutF
MIFDPKSVSPGAMYRFMIGVIVPRPIAFVSTVGAGGQFNVAPFSYFNGITNVPPLLGISVNLRSGTPKHTLSNIRATGDFVINVVNEELAGRMVEASGDWPEEVDEFQLTGLTPVPSDLVKSPRVGESPVGLECRLYREIELGQTVFVVGEILRAHVSEAVLTEGRVDILKLKPLGRLGGDGYTTVREILHLPRPKVTPGAEGSG